VDVSILGKISMNQQSIISADLDYKYLDEMEGTSARNIKRKCRFNNDIDHLKHPNEVVSKQMKSFFAVTKEPKNFNLRDTTIE